MKHHTKTTLVAVLISPQALLMSYSLLECNLKCSILKITGCLKINNQKQRQQLQKIRRRRKRSNWTPHTSFLLAPSPTAWNKEASSGTKRRPTVACTRRAVSRNWNSGLSRFQFRTGSTVWPQLTLCLSTLSSRWCKGTYDLMGLSACSPLKKTSNR